MNICMAAYIHCWGLLKKPQHRWSLEAFPLNNIESWRKQVGRKYNVWRKKIAFPHRVSATLITICVLLNTLQAKLHALCIVMRSSEESQSGAVLKWDEWGEVSKSSGCSELPCYTQDRNLPTQPNTCIHITIKISLQTYTGKKQKPQHHVITFLAILSTATSCPSCHCLFCPKHNLTLASLSAVVGQLSLLCAP